jgi:monoamine oxidase
MRPTYHQERIPGGTQRIAEQLAHQMQQQVLTDTPVLAIRQDHDSVIAYSRGNSFRARYAILAIPPAVAEQIYFEPTLPAARDTLHQRVIMGRAISATLCYDYPFWRENGKSGVYISNEGPVTLVHDVSPASGTEGALACLISGNDATHWGAQPKSERLRAIVTQLQPWFGDEINAYRGLIERDWNSERWSRGATGFMPNGAAQYIQSLALPIGRLHFAGGETATHWTNTLEGAIEAGERAAAEVIVELSSGGYLRKMIANE